MNDDDFLTEDDKDIQRRMSLLSEQANRGNLFGDWLRSPAGVLFSRMLDEQIQDAKGAWLAATDREKAEVVRIQSQVYLKIKQWIAAQIQTGKVAQSAIADFEKEGAALSNIIKVPERPTA